MPSVNTIHLAHCPVCGSEHLPHGFACTDHYTSGEVFQIHACSRCGFRFTQDFPCEAEIGRYYDSANYISHSSSREGLMNKVYHLARSFMLNRKAALVARWSKKGGKVLDVGCGTGHFLHTLQRKGWQVQGVEVNEGARRMATEHFGLDVDGTQRLWNTAAESYDVITLWHVLEHLEKLNESVVRLRELLRPNGTLIIAVPNCAGYDADVYRQYWAAYDVPRHLWHFTPATMQQLMTKHGLQIVAQKAMPLDAFYISLISERYKDTAAPLGFLRACLTGLQGGLRSLTNVGASGSVIYVIKRS